MSLRSALALRFPPPRSPPCPADTILTTSPAIIQNNICVGADCQDPESYDSQIDAELRLKGVNTRLTFADTSSSSSFPTHSWQLRANDSYNGGLDMFSLIDQTSATVPLTILGGAPDNRFFMNASGLIGIGTSVPGRDLHVSGVVGDFAVIRIEAPTTINGSVAYDFGVTGGGFAIQPATGASSSAFSILNGVLDTQLQLTPGEMMVNSTAKNVNFRVRSDDSSTLLFTDADENRVGIGTDTPDALLNLYRNDGTAQMLIEEASATTSPRTLLNLQNNGRPEIVMGNTSTGGEWSFGAGTNFILKQGAVGSASDAKTKLFEVDALGNATLTGSLVTGGGTTCGGGCDAVFAPDYPLPSIAEHTAQMHSLGYLPNVGPTLENTPINVTDKLGGILNELEHAHLYIAQQEAAIDALKTEHAARISALEAQLAELARRLD
ncbi:MAG: hypothetical protein R3D85_13350 [Paracoccaceae bacterium]